MAPKRKAKRRSSGASCEVDSSTSRNSDITKKQALQVQIAQINKTLQASKDAKVKEIRRNLDAVLFPMPNEILKLSMEEINSREDFISMLESKLKEAAQKAHTHGTRLGLNIEADGDTGKRNSSTSRASRECQPDTTLDNSEESRDQFFCSGVTTVKRKRRSRSLGVGSVEQLANVPKRSCSVMPSGGTYQTPKNCELGKRLMSHKKYTVRKQIRVQESAVNVKRVMRAGEEAISVSGSPLFVQSGTSVTEPQVMIPLPGGVIVNIEPNKVSNKLPNLPIDPQIRQQIKTLHENLGKLMAR